MLLAFSGAAVAAPAASAAGGERAAANKIAGELGDLIRKLARETFTASQALGAARITAAGKPGRIPAATQAAWQRRLHDIDQAHANIIGVHGADAARTAAVDVLGVLRAVSRAGQLVLTSPTASQRTHYAKQQQADEDHLHRAVETLTASLRHAGATHL